MRGGVIGGAQAVGKRLEREHTDDDVEHPRQVQRCGEHAGDHGEGKVVPLGIEWPPEPCEDGTCPVARAVAVLDGKWTMLVVRDLLGGPRRFGELRESLAGISPKTLTDRLRELEAAGLVVRTMYPEIPPRVEYRLTERGQDLRSVLAALGRFGRSLTA